jgi:RimJ/RimL family protein N-acetyltransferase
MVVVQDTDIETVKSIFSNKQLFNASMPDEDRMQNDLGLWEPDPNCVWEFVELCNNDEVVGIIRYQPISIVAIDCHIHLLPKYWGSKLSDEIIPAFEQYILKNTKYHKLQVQCPQCCKHTIQCAARHGFEIEGVLMGASFWDNKIENLVLMGKFIRRI